MRRPSPVEIALQLLEGRRVSWIVIRDGESFYVGHKRAGRLHKRFSAAAFSEVTQRGEIQPSLPERQGSFSRCFTGQNSAVRLVVTCGMPV